MRLRGPSKAKVCIIACLESRKGGGRGGKETKKLSTAGFLPQHSSVIILLSEGFLVEREALKSWKDFVSLNSEQMKNHAASNSRQHLAKFHKNNPY